MRIFDWNNIDVYLIDSHQQCILKILPKNYDNWVDFTKSESINKMKKDVVGKLFFDNFWWNNINEYNGGGGGNALLSPTF